MHIAATRGLLDWLPHSVLTLSSMSALDSGLYSCLLHCVCPSNTTCNGTSASPSTPDVPTVQNVPNVPGHTTSMASPTSTPTSARTTSRSSACGGVEWSATVLQVRYDVHVVANGGSWLSAALSHLVDTWRACVTELLPALLLFLALDAILFLLLLALHLARYFL